MGQLSILTVSFRLETWNFKLKSVQKAVCLQGGGWLSLYVTMTGSE